MSISEAAAGLTRVSLRRRASEHPMAMFAVISGVAFAGMIALQPAGPALFSLNIAAEAATPNVASRDISEADAPVKISRVQPSGTDLACNGQAWGAETADCLAMIARDSGRIQPRAIRVITDATPVSVASNQF